jgi:hypothetical protein
MATPPTVHSIPPTPERATGSRFYKYGSLAEPIQLQRLEKILLEHRIYVPTAAQYKDPMDCRPRLAPLSEDKMFSTFYGSSSGFTVGNTRLKVLERLQLEATIRAHARETLMRVIERDKDEQFKEFRAYCLSKRFDNPVMWEYYADDHRGYCLEFANEGAFFRSAKEVIYGDTTEMDLSNPEHLKSWLLFCKRQVYCFEEEVRVHWPRILGDSVSIDPHHLTRIIFGQKMSEAHRKRILELAKQRNPQLAVYVALWDEYKKEFRLVRQDCS